MATAASPFSASFQDPTKAGQYAMTGAPPPGATPQAAGVAGPAPGNDINQISGWYDQYLGAGRAQSGATDIANWAGSGLGLGDIQNRIANSPEAMAYAQSQAPPAAATAPAATAPPPSGAAAPTGARTGTMATGSSTTGMGDPRSSAFFDMLMSRVDQTPQVDPNDPAIKSSTDAYAAQQERQRRSSLSQMAEKGGDNQNLTAVDRSMAESAGQHTGAFQAGLINEERQARRSQIQNMLSLGGSFLTSEQQMALQKELSDMNLAERGYEFDSNMAYQTSPFSAGYNS